MPTEPVLWVGTSGIVTVATVVKYFHSIDSYSYHKNYVDRLYGYFLHFSYTIAYRCK